MREIERVFKEYAPSVNSFFQRRGFPPEECHDLTQETFLRAVHGVRSFRHEAALETWLIQIATNVWKNHLRSLNAIKRRASTVPIDSVGQDESEVESSRPGGGVPFPTPQELLLERERTRLLREALEELPPRMRRCALLRIEQGLKYREIASIMRTSIDTVKTQLHQARHRLKEQLQEYFDLERGHER